MQKSDLDQLAFEDPFLHLNIHALIPLVLLQLL